MAAGGSSRLDSPKQLLSWGNDYLINSIIDVVSQAGIAPIYIILGSQADEIRRVIHHPTVKFVFNPQWQAGMSSSIQRGVEALPEDIDGAFIFLSDQPFITPALIGQISETFLDTNASIAAPRVGSQQCNPVLFRRTLFPELMTISGDRGAKSLLAQHKVAWVDWPDENLLLDIDSAEDYRQALVKRASY